MSAGRVDLSSELVDWLTEAVVLPADPQLRAASICAVVEAVVDAVGWRAGDQIGTAELVSVASILQAAQDHQTRMGSTSQMVSRADHSHVAMA